MAVLVAGGCTAAFTNYADQPGPRFAGGPTAPPLRTQGALKVVTWNVKWGERPAAAADAILRNVALRDADLFVLQEMNEQSVATIAARLGAGYVYYPATLHPRVRRNVGTAILSRWPLAEDRKLLLPNLAWFTRTGRAAVVATAVVRGLRVRVYGVHLAPALSVGLGGLEEQLRAIVADASGSADPVVLAGDFNTPDVGRLLAAAGYQWLTRRVGPTAWVRSIDHVFVRGFGAASPSAGAVADDGLPSDHRPVWAVIQ